MTILEELSNNMTTLGGTLDAESTGPLSGVNALAEQLSVIPSEKLASRPAVSPARRVLNPGMCIGSL